MITEYQLRDMALGTGAWRLRMEWLNMMRGSSSPLSGIPIKYHG